MWSTYRRRLAILGCIGGGFLFLSDMLGWDKLGDRDWLLKLTAVAFAIPLILWEMQHPQPLSLSIGETGLIFRFVNQEYAADFAELNGAESRPGRHAV